METLTLEQYCQRYAIHEALRQAKARVREQLKAEGHRVANFTAKEITLRAEAMLEANHEPMLTAAVQRLIQRFGATS
jgi:hypothetical protein